MKNDVSLNPLNLAISNFFLLVALLLFDTEPGDNKEVISV